jgi:branched-chain amino acid transport system ATP-binding protein
MSMLEVQHLEAGYDYLQVLWDISLHVDEGEFVALLGPNGAGKTTLLRSISGVLLPKAGRVTLAEKPITGLTAHQTNRCGLSYIPEDLNLFPNMTVHENLLLGGYSIRDKKHVAQTMSFVLGLFPILDNRRNQLAGTLSGGERKMLGVARGLMSDPKLILVDEPSLGLAPLVVKTVFDALKELSRRGITILLVEQNVNLTLQITHRGYVLEHGRLVAEGPSAELLRSAHLQETYLGVSTPAAAIGEVS